jgi:hypothetical protein
MTDLLLRRASESRPGADGQADMTYRGGRAGHRPHLQGEPIPKWSTLALPTSGWLQLWMRAECLIPTKGTRRPPAHRPPRYTPHTL